MLTNVQVIATKYVLWKNYRFVTGLTVSTNIFIVLSATKVGIYTKMRNRNSP